VTDNRKWIPAAAVGAAAALGCAGAVLGRHYAQTGAVSVPLPAIRTVTVPSALGADPHAAALKACADLVARLPATLEGGGRRAVAGSDPQQKQRAAAWGAPATTLVCGVNQPPANLEGGPDYTPDANDYETVGDGGSMVNWFIEPVDGGWRYTTTDRAVAVQVFVPTDREHAAGPAVDLAAAIVRTIPNSDGKYVSDQP
jgi:hypothetical protein